MGTTKQECLIEEKKMIGFMAYMLMKVMCDYNNLNLFNEKERDTVNAICEHFIDHADYVFLTEDEKEWNKTL